jgi:hypothetical protein
MVTQISQLVTATAKIYLSNVYRFFTIIRFNVQIDLQYIHHRFIFRQLQPATQLARLLGSVVYSKDKKSDNVVMLGQLRKNKAIPLQAKTGPEGSSKLRLTDFKTIGT